MTLDSWISYFIVLIVLLSETVEKMNRWSIEHLPRRSSDMDRFHLTTQKKQQQQILNIEQKLCL